MLILWYLRDVIDFSNDSYFRYIYHPFGYIIHGPTNPSFKKLTLTDSSAWSTSGCTTNITSNYTVMAYCNHLTAFSIQKVRCTVRRIAKLHPLTLNFSTVENLPHPLLGYPAWLPRIMIINNFATQIWLPRIIIINNFATQIKILSEQRNMTESNSFRVRWCMFQYQSRSTFTITALVSCQ